MRFTGMEVDQCAKKFKYQKINSKLPQALIAPGRLYPAYRASGPSTELRIDARFAVRPLDNRPAETAQSIPPSPTDRQGSYSMLSAILVARMCNARCIADSRR
jgi:hypothetical protein